MPTVYTATVYPGMCLVEGTELSEGRAERLGNGFASLLMLTVVMAGGLGLALLAVAPLLSDLFDHLYGLKSSLTALLQFAAVASAAIVLQGGVNGMLVGCARFNYAATINFIAVCLFAVVLLPLNEWLGVTGTLAALALLFTLAASLGLWINRHDIARDLREATPHIVTARARSMLGFFVPTLLAAGIVTPVVVGPILLRGNPLARSPGSTHPSAGFRS
jgi:O-antigen/teichoic acid export membrane protein